MEEKRDKKSVHRIIPCPDYDVTGVECWLSYMAEQGYDYTEILAHYYPNTELRLESGE